MLRKDKALLEGLKKKYSVEELKNNVNEAFFNRYKENPYKEEKGLNRTNVLKDDISLYHIRQRLEEIVRNCNIEDIDIAKKQVRRLYALVDNMINQGYIVEK